MKISTFYPKLPALFLAYLFIIIYTQIAKAETCSPQPNQCIQVREEGFQPRRSTLKDDIDRAATATLGGNAVPYPDLERGIPPNSTQITVSTDEPLPSILLRGMFWQESKWLHYADSIIDDDTQTACTFVATDCGYGITQYTDCMSGEQSCVSLAIDPFLIADSLPYNLSAGTRVLLYKWDAEPPFDLPYIGANDHTLVEDWYYSAIAYNGYSVCNNPNRIAENGNCPLPAGFAVNRPLFSDNSNLPFPYQEKVFGFMENPELVNDNTSVIKRLWRESYYAYVPRGIFGLRDPNNEDEWRPPSTTPRPEMHLLRNISKNSAGILPTITVENTTNETLAYDIIFYTDDHNFDSRWLIEQDTPFNRLNANEVQTLELSHVLIDDNFSGYARVHASEGVEFELNIVPSDFIYLPMVIGANANARAVENQCDTQLSNGGFEQLVGGRPVDWEIDSPEQYSLVDATWFHSGHYGAHLGGHRSYIEKMSSDLILPSAIGGGGAYLEFNWSVRTQEPASRQPVDYLKIRLRDSNGGLISEIDDLKLSNQDASNSWGSARVNLRFHVLLNQPFTLSFESSNDSFAPTDFFIDDVKFTCPTLREIPTNLGLSEANTNNPTPPYVVFSLTIVVLLAASLYLIKQRTASRTGHEPDAASL